MFIQKQQISTVPKNKLRIILPYLDKMSQIVETKLTKTMNKHIKVDNRLKRGFRFKDFVPETLRSSLIYNFLYRSYTVSYIGKTYRHFKVRVSEHQGVSPRTDKQVKGTLSSSVRDQMLVCDHKVMQEDFKFLGNESNRYLLELKECLFTKRDKPDHLIRTDTRRIYSFYLTLLQILF